jgi:PST family polysaccharide transporter
MVTRKEWFKARFLWGKVNRNALRELSGFGLMGLTSALTVPVSYMLIREYLVNKLGLQAAGYWQASWKLSEIYLMLITTTLSVYFLPRLAEIRSAHELKLEIIKVYRFVMPVVVVSAIGIYVLRDFIINILFSKDFLPMRDLFLWQLAGDVIKIGSWIAGYVLIGRGIVKVFLSVEVIFSISFFLLSCLFVNIWGLQGVPMAYLLNYLLCWAYVGYWVMKEIRQMEIMNG